ncbi:hypothetical protein HDN1F_06070 [gamma proteobacterium HdN1]|nr:hypothetical protein HDN1F_06070 [gamma proteobacterium HdN1]
MNAKTPSKLTDIATLTLLIATLILPESNNTFAIYAIGLIFLVVIRFTFDPINPYFYLAPASLYLAGNLIYLFIINGSQHSIFFSCAYLGILTFSLASNVRPNRQEPPKITTKSKPLVSLFLISISISTAIYVAARLKITPQVAMAAHLAMSPVLTAVIFGSLIAISSKKLILALGLSTIYLAQITLNNIFAEDSSRLSILDYTILIFLIAYFRRRKKAPLRKNELKAINSSLGLALIASFAAIASTSNLESLGGDALIALNAVAAISAAKGHHEYLMPFFNGGLILIPEIIWPFTKPIAYNSSSWYIENVLNMPANDYPWGVGITLFAASYLYGGLPGVALMFGGIGLFVRHLLRLSTNIFWIGFTCYFLMRLPLAFYRMDETFILGSAAPMLLTMAAFIRIYKRKIDNCFLATENPRITRN